MARPKKTGLDYFPLDVDMAQDDKIELIEAQHGIVGFAMIIRLLMLIYKNGYFYKWTEKEQLLFSKRVNVDINEVNVIINDCIKWGLFNSEVYEKHGILTSKGIQKRYLEAVGRRQKVSIRAEYLLLDKKILIDYRNVSIEGVNVDINPINEGVNVDINPQSKVKESKVNNSKEDEEVSAAESKTFKDIVDAFNKNIHPIAPMEGEKLKDWTNDLDCEVIIKAIEEAVSNNARTINYINAILNSWHSKGIKDIQGVEAYLRDRADKKLQQGNKNNNHDRNNKSNNKFNDFEQRATKYSNDELEKILGVKKGSENSG